MNLLALPPLVALVFAAQDKPEPKRVDYEAMLNDTLGKGITPEKNANVLLWKAMGPTPEGGTGMPAEYFKRLGIPEPPKQGHYFVGLHAYMRDHLKLDPGEFTPVYDQQGAASARPWAAKDYPRIAAWLTLNEKPLVVVVEATKRPEYYNPLVSRKTEKDPGYLIGALLPNVQKCRELAAALTARAMLRVREGKFDDAWADLTACHRLGRLTARGATLIESLVGMAIHQIACNATAAYLEHAPLTSKQILERLDELRKLPPLPPMADKIDVGERAMFNDSLQLLSRGEDKSLVTELRIGELIGLKLIDWETPRQTGNQWYDRMAAAMRLKDRAEREKAFAAIEEELERLVKAARQKKPDPKEKDIGKVVGKQVGDILIGLLAPAIRKVQGSHDRASQVEHNLHVAFALAAYHRDAGRYPAKLDDLAPKYLPAVPGDHFSGKPLVYKPEEKGYLFYSVGLNGKDDGGRWTDADPPGDDPGVRMPLPPRK